jgi:hypothetical protein
MHYLYSMAIQKQRKKIWGRRGDVCYYPSVYGWMARLAGGPSRKQFMKSAAFARARENSSEFSLCAKMAGEVRREVILYTKKLDKKLYHRLMKLMRLLANDDTGSVRGKRDPRTGMNTEEGQKRLKSFKITRRLYLYKVLVKSGYLNNERESGGMAILTEPSLMSKNSSRRKRKDRVFQPRVVIINTVSCRKDKGVTEGWHREAPYCRVDFLAFKGEKRTFRRRHSVAPIHHMGDG